MKKVGMIIGILGSIYGLYIVGAWTSFKVMDYGPGMKIGLVTSILAIVASALVGKYPKLMGAALIILGVVNAWLPWPGRISGFAMVLAGILVLVSAFMKTAPHQIPPQV